MLPERYPSEGRLSGIGIVGNIATDGEDKFWSVEPDNLKRQFQRLIAERIAAREIEHLSVFALGPIPLLDELGNLLGDITPDISFTGSQQVGDGRRTALALRMSVHARPRSSRRSHSSSASVPPSRMIALHPYWATMCRSGRLRLKTQQ